MAKHFGFPTMMAWIVSGLMTTMLASSSHAATTITPATAAAPGTTATPVAASSLLPARVLQAARDRVAAGEYPMLVIGVVNGDRSRLYGLNAAGEKAPDAQTVFEIGSVTKTFTGLLLAEAVKAGRVTLDEPVAKILSGFEIPSRNGKVITLGNLATQYSGLPRLPANLKPENPADPYAGYDAEELKSFLVGYKLPRDPGSDFEYSNLGYGLLGFVLARRAGLGYGALLRRDIFMPLGMTLTGIAIDANMREHLAAGHDASGNVTPNWNLNVLAGAGAIKSTGAAMMRYLKANMGVTQTPLYAAMELAHQPRAAGPGANRVGLGWMILDTGSNKVLWHNGMTGGYASFIGFTADGEKGVFVLTNIQRSVDDLGFATLVDGAELAPVRTTIQVEPEVLDDYVGYYRLAPRFLLVVFRSGDQLYAEATGQGAFPIYPSAEDEFYAEIGGISLSFLRGSADKVVGLTLHQHGDTQAPQVDAAAAAEAIGQQLVALDEATLREYIGRYRLGPNRIFEITLKQGQLYAQLTGQPAMPIYPSARDHFFYILVNAEIVFERNGKGEVTALVLHQNGAEQRAPRITTP